MDDTMNLERKPEIFVFESNWWWLSSNVEVRPPKRFF
jgi:hypothetical protein